jgi:hypothetical protein
MLIYPNPASNQINLNVSGNSVGGNYKLFDYTGKLILSNKIISENTIININNLCNGIYLICTDVNAECTYFSVQSK